MSYTRKAINKQSNYKETSNTNENIQFANTLPNSYFRGSDLTIIIHKEVSYIETNFQNINKTYRNDI